MSNLTQADDLHQKENQSKLTDWKNPPNVSDLRHDLKSASPMHQEQVAKVERYLDNLNVTGTAQPPKKRGRSAIVPKLIRKQAEWRYASLSEPFLSTDELFEVAPVTWEDKKSAEHNKLILAKQFNNDINKVGFIDEYVRTLVDEGTAILRVGWEFIEEEVEEEVPIIEFFENHEMGELHEQLAQMQAESPAEFEEGIPEELKQAHAMTMEMGVPIEPVVHGYETQLVMKTVVNRPTVEVCDHRNVIIDPTCNGDIEQAKFVIFSFESDLATLRKDGKYSNLDQIIAPSSPLAEPDHAIDEGAANFEFQDEPRKKLAVFEYWGYWDIDGDGTVKPIVATWVGNTLIRLEENPYPDKKIPFIVVQYLPVRKAVYGEPDGSLLEDNQRVAGAVTRSMVDLLGKAATGQMGSMKGALDPINKRKMDRGEDYEFNGNMNPATAFFTHVHPDIPTSAQYMLDLQNMEAESITGVKSFSQGMSQGSLGNVATSVRGVLDAATKREIGILRRMADGIVQMGKKFISMNAEFLSEKEIVRITNEHYEVVYRDSLAGNFDLRLSIATPEQDETKAQELAFMLQTMGNNMDFSMSQFILAEIAKLRKMPSLAKQIMDYAPQPDPMAEQLQMMEMQLMEARINSENARAAYYQTYSGYNENRGQTELYKQAEMQADIDQKNLDFVEQEAGVKQAREKELRGEQARSQMELKQLDHQLKEESKERDLIREYLSGGNSQ